MIDEGLAARVDVLTHKVKRLEDAVQETRQGTQDRVDTIESRMGTIEKRQSKAESMLLDLLQSSSSTNRGIDGINATLKDLGDKLEKVLNAK